MGKKCNNKDLGRAFAGILAGTLAAGMMPGMAVLPVAAAGQTTGLYTGNKVEDTALDAQTGISASYEGTVQCGQSIDKSAMTVLETSKNAPEGSQSKPVAQKDFMVIRATAFTDAEESSRSLDDEETILKAMDPAPVLEEDFGGKGKGILSVVVVQFKHGEDGKAVGRYITSVNINIEDPGAWSEETVHYDYSNLTDIANQAQDLKQQISDYGKQVGDLQKNTGDENAYTELSSQIAAVNAAIKKQQAIIDSYENPEADPDKGVMGISDVTDKTAEEAQKVLNDQASTEKDKAEAREILASIGAGEKSVDPEEKTDETILDAAKAQLYILENKRDDLEAQLADVSNTAGAIRSLNKVRKQVKASAAAVNQNLKEYTDANDMANNDGEHRDANGNLLVYVNGNAIPYDENTGVSKSFEEEDGSSHEYTVYSANGDIDGDGTKENFEFYNDLSGTHVSTDGWATEFDSTPYVLAVQEVKDELHEADQLSTTVDNELDKMVNAVNNGELTDTEGNTITIDPEDDGDTDKKIDDIKAALITMMGHYGEAEKTYKNVTDAVYGDDPESVTTDEISEAAEALRTVDKEADDLAAQVDNLLNLYGDELGDEKKKTLQDLKTDVSKTKATLDADAAELDSLKEAMEGDEAPSKETLSQIKKTRSQVKALAQENAELNAKQEYSTDDSVVSSQTNNYQAGYEKGYALAYEDGYKKGYSAGTANAGSSSSGSTSDSDTSNTSTGVTGMQTRISDLEKQVSSLQKENDTLNNDVKTLKESNDKYEESGTSLSDANSELQTANTALSGQVSSLKTAISSLNANDQTIANQVKTLQSTLGTLQTDNNNLKQQAQSANQQAQSSAAQLKAAQAAAQQASKAAQDATALAKSAQTEAQKATEKTEAVSKKQESESSDDAEEGSSEGASENTEESGTSGSTQDVQEESSQEEGNRARYSYPTDNNGSQDNAFTGASSFTDDTQDVTLPDTFVNTESAAGGTTSQESSTISDTAEDSTTAATEEDADAEENKKTGGLPMMLAIFAGFGAACFFVFKKINGGFPSKKRDDYDDDDELDEFDDDDEDEKEDDEDEDEEDDGEEDEEEDEEEDNNEEEEDDSDDEDSAPSGNTGIKKAASGVSDKEDSENDDDIFTFDESA